jgi:hypothetical protein
MESTFAITRTSREIYKGYLEKYSLGQLNKIPEGFSNNLFWNIAHIVVSHQLLVYAASGNPMLVSDELVSLYRGGTRPERDATAQEVGEIKSLLVTTIEQTEKDYHAGLFKTYTERKTGLGFMLSTIEDALTFNNYHEGTHLGIMMSIRKFT